MNNIQSICVFCASSESVDDLFKDIALELGRELGRRGIDLVYGGASIGLMGCVARGYMRRREKLSVFCLSFSRPKISNILEADELIVTQNMRERKAVMDKRSDAFIVLPGGIGTLKRRWKFFPCANCTLPTSLWFLLTLKVFMKDCVQPLRKWWI